MVHIKAYFPTIRPYNCDKKDSKIGLSLRRRRIIHENLCFTDYVDRRVTHQSGLPHLPGVPHLHVNMP